MDVMERIGDGVVTRPELEAEGYDLAEVDRLIAERKIFVSKRRVQSGQLVDVYESRERAARRLTWDDSK